ncbi:MAG: Na+/H+ antiporter NhaA [Actinomycetota bacterium]
MEKGTEGSGEANLADEPHLGVPWSRSDRRLPRFVARPLQQFLRTEAAGGILLLGATIVALVWANCWNGSYAHVWQTDLTVSLGPWSISEDLRHWVNDAPMALFFFVVGLEIKRELVSGELRDPRAAALPAFGALGGMAVPALIYAAINAGGEGFRGWGIPMATDIAFAVGVLAIVGRGLPSGLRLFLLTLAIVDDIGAIVVIAIFYSGGISWAALASAAGLLCVIALLRRAQVRAMAIYVVLGLGVWLAVLESGVHATIAGVALGLLAPTVPFQRPSAVSQEAHRIADETLGEPVPADVDAHQWLRLANLSRETVSPLARMESLLHPWTSFVIVPLFALANAGVYLGGGALGQGASSRITIGVLVGLVAGKPLGITLAAWAATRLGLARLPHGVRWSQVLGVSAIAGIGFTVSLFIAGLAFAEDSALSAAKVGVLAASLTAGCIGSALLLLARRGAAGTPQGAAQ